MSPAAWTVAVVIAATVAITAIVWATCLWRADSKPENRGRHAVRPERSHARTGPASGADAEQAATEFIAALKDGTEGEGPEPARHAVDVEARFQAALHAEGLDEPVPLLSAPVAPAEAETPAEPPPPLVAALEPLPPMAVITADPEPPADRGTLDTRREWAAPTADLLARLRDSLKALPGGGEPARVPDGMPAGPAPVLPSRKRAVPDWLTTSGVNAFLPVLEIGDVGAFVDRVFAPAEEAVSAAVAEHLGSEKKADFAGVSVAGLPDDGWDLSAPVLSLPGGTVPEVTP